MADLPRRGKEQLKNMHSLHKLMVRCISHVANSFGSLKVDLIKLDVSST